MTAQATRLGEFGTATLHESGATPLPPQLRPLDPAWRICGYAFTVRLTPGNNIWLHRALYAAAPGDVLVASTGGAFEFGYWGDILTSAAIARRLGGLVLDGCVRDSAELLQLGFPVFSRGLCVRGTGKDTTGGDLDADITIGSVVVRPGDLVVGDADGVVVSPREDAAVIGERAARREDKEASVRRRIAAGESTLDIYGF
ncbi:RraA family protein [Amycolatopsis sp. SID8362]|uniref:RraA family protein n=1 Tax=Amycolatopsis sp. SID8362 TaxID=2690346 RepID=UPI00136ADDCD|nr:RraA family protein [Amycolatopsis sp. SID8362]NBH07437.1 4-hydroxy-4-methyl-2-oxoglutarate aldolase [Amycolatopsis sp. SID8362]NED44133.1 RraA family protein [Amycolatopsis sp. SID8362]